MAAAAPALVAQATPPNDTPAGPASAVPAAAPAAPAPAAAPLAYTVRIDAPAPLDALLAHNLDLLRWRGNPRLDAEQLQRLIKLAPEQVRTLVATEGYYAPKVDVRMQGGDLVLVSVTPGEPVRVGAVDLELLGFNETDTKAYDTAGLRTRWGLKTGSIFRQADWELAKRDLLRRAQQTRYPRAQLVDTGATVDPETHSASLRVVLASGPALRLGALRVEGLARYPARIVADLNPVHPGEEYSESTLQAYQSLLQDTGYFSGVEVSADLSALPLDADPAAGEAPPRASLVVPLLVRVSENKRRNVSAGVGFSTNTGNRAQLSYDDLSVFGLRLKSAITLETKAQSAHADFTFPTTAAGYSDSLGAKFERTDIEGTVTGVTTVDAKRSWGTPLYERSLTLEYLNEQLTVTGFAPTVSQSLPLTYTVTRRHLDNLLFPTTGYVLNASIGGALLPILTDQAFVRATAKFITYRPLSATSTVVLRFETGGVASRQKSGVPDTYLFRAGGDQSVRGYAYQELGVAEGTAIVGGRYLLDGSAEYQYWFKPAWGAAVFYDAGNAGDIFRELKPKSGYGIGARWRSPVGPINVDAAYGHADRKYRLHFSLGFTF